MFGPQDTHFSETLNPDKILCLKWLMNTRHSSLSKNLVACLHLIGSMRSGKGYLVLVTCSDYPLCQLCLYHIPCQCSYLALFLWDLSSTTRTFKDPP